jgi:saccharopine dehydrogenase-like NADP-dependent oxidoreductase
MMKILLLGVGMQGKAALHDLVMSPGVSRVIAADVDLDSLREHALLRGYGRKLDCRPLDAADPKQIAALMAEKPRVVIDLLPVPYRPEVARQSVRHGCHLVTTYYTTRELESLADEARTRGVAILPEFGLDPGIDLVMMGETVRTFDTVGVIRSYGGGVPEPGAADNPLKYKIIWSFTGVLRAYRRRGAVVRKGRKEEIAPEHIFDPAHTHHIEIPGLGPMEAYPNGDASIYLDTLGIDPASIGLMGRYALRWPGHCALWNTLSDLHLLDENPVHIDGIAVDRHRYLAEVLTPHLTLGESERDMAIIRVEVEGVIKGRAEMRAMQMVDRRDLNTGLTAMSRTVGYTASIGAQMIATGEITATGLLSPVRDVPFDAFSKALSKRGIHITDGSIKSTSPRSTPPW